MLKKRGRPRGKSYETSYTIRLNKRDLEVIRYNFDRYCVATYEEALAFGHYDRRGKSKSFNDYMVAKLKGAKL